jgi:hypothetical protein
MELVLVPFVLPLLLLGRLIELWQSSRTARPRVIDERTLRRTWFSLHGRPRLAEADHEGREASD